MPRLPAQHERSSSRRLSIRVALAAALLLGAAAPGQRSVPMEDTPLGACPGDAIAADQVHEGRFPGELTGSYVMLPFEVPAGTTQVRVKYCFEGDGHTVDLGLWEAQTGRSPWGVEEFRGWGGSSHPDVAVTPQGFSSEAEYEADPRGHVPGRTTRGFLPGPIPAGTWAVELGVAAVVPVEDGDEDGFADWRVEIELSRDPAFAADPYVPAAYDTTPAISESGWYTGDMHVHAEHSALGDATMRETFDFAFRPISEGGAGLDFITLSDYVTPSAWGEIGRFQADYPGKLVIRSSEIITYRGHTNNHASLRYVDHRTGPVYELDPDTGRLRLLRLDRDPRKIFKEVRAAGGWTQLNHVTTCPSSVPACARLCRGCPWDFLMRETKPRLVDAVEIATGPPELRGLFGADPVGFWEDLLDLGHKIAAVGSSDSHHAGTPQTSLQSPIGTAATVVFAEELSERGIRDGVRAGHTYVKIHGSDKPDLRLEATVPGDPSPPAIFGDTVRARAVDFRAEVLDVEPEDGTLELVVLKDGAPIDSISVAAPGATHTFSSTGPGRYRLELHNGDDIWLLSSPVYIERKGRR